MLLIDGSGACGLGWIGQGLSVECDGGRCGGGSNEMVDKLVKREVG